MRSRTPSVITSAIAATLLAALALGVAIAQRGVDPGAPQGTHHSDRYLIIHIDAVSFQTYQRALAEGRLPTFEGIFADGATRPALSLFPGSTPVIYSRLRTGEANDEGVALGIGG